MQVRAVVSDLDGTLLLPDSTLGEATRRAILSLDAAGIPFLAATGRSLYGIRDTLAPVRDAVTLGISSSGAIGYHPGRAEMLWRHQLEPATLRQVVDALGHIAPRAGLAGFDGEGWIVTQSYFEVRGLWPSGPVDVAPAAHLATSGCCALVVTDAQLDSASLAGALADAGVGPETATITYAGPNLLDVVPPDVDKGYGIRRACDLLGIDPANVLAFGDGPNDIALFQAVGHAIAVSNAHPTVLAAANQIAPSNAEEGVAKALADLGLVTATVP